MQVPTLGQVYDTLLTGKAVVAPDSSVSISLPTPRARALASEILTALEGSSPDALINDDNFFQALEQLHSLHEDPAGRIQKPSTDSAIRHATLWTLYRVTARGFGGLNTDHTSSFAFDVNNDNWILEGQNGTGKSSITNCLLFALTGKIYRDQIGIINRPDSPEPVYDTAGNKIAEWPHIATYPATWENVNPSIEVSVSLDFFDRKCGQWTTVERQLSGPAQNLTESLKDPCNLTADQLNIETGILMPLRLHNLRITHESDNQQILSLLQQVTGLDPLNQVATLATYLNDGRKRFRRYAKDNKIEQKEKEFNDDVVGARTCLKQTEFEQSLPININPSDDIIPLQTLIEKLNNRAADSLTTLESFIRNDANLTEDHTRDSVTRSVRRLSQNLHTIEVGNNITQTVAALDALEQKQSDGTLKTLTNKLSDIEARYHRARALYRRQTEDTKLRLKAVASTFVDKDDEQPECPLCERTLHPEYFNELIDELKRLKSDGDIAQDTLESTCLKLSVELHELVRQIMPPYFTQPNDIHLPDDISTELYATLVEGSNINYQLPGLEQSIKAQLNGAFSQLEKFNLNKLTGVDERCSNAEKTLINNLNFFKNIFTAVDWWATNRDQVDALCRDLLTDRGTSNIYEVIQTSLRAVDQSAPFQQASHLLERCRSKAAEFQRIQETQAKRDEIAEDIAALKDLGHFATTVTRQTINDLSSAAEHFYNDIHHREALRYQRTDVTSSRRRSSITFFARPQMSGTQSETADDWAVDAAILANSSWTRGILWSFIFAMREKARAQPGASGCALVCLDDPQLTFDSRNRRAWAEKLEDIALDLQQNKGHEQLIILTHDREFWHFFAAGTNIKLGGVERAVHVGGSTQIVHEHFAEVRYRHAIETGSDESARRYIGDVRILAETLLKHAISRFEPAVLDPQKHTLSSILRDILRPKIQSDTPPFNTKEFKDVLEVFNENGPLARLINEPHHTFSDTITTKQAAQVHSFWQDRLFPVLREVWRIYRHENKTVIGETAAIALPANTNHSPAKAKNLGEVDLPLVGRVAAFSGRTGSAGDGEGLLWSEESESLSLSGLGAYLLCEDTLFPVAVPGDVLLVSLKPGSQPGDFVVEDRGSMLAARKFSVDLSYQSIAALVSMSASRDGAKPPILTRSQAKTRRTVMGVLFQPYISLDISEGDEAVSIPDDSYIKRHLEDTVAFTIVGESAEPKASDGQKLLVSADNLIGTLNTPDDLNGEIVVVTTEDGETYFKRFWHQSDGVCTLDSIGSLSQNGGLSVEFEGVGKGLKTILEIRRVKGVLF